MGDLGSFSSTQRDTFVGWMRDNGFGWWATNAFDGNASGVYYDEAYIPGWRDALRAAGLNFGVWAVHRTDPAADAVRADRVIREYGCDFYIADAEDEYRSDLGDKTRSETFCAAFRGYQPTIKAALTFYGAASGDNVYGLADDATNGVFDFAAWYSRGFHLLPQAYYNQSDQYRPVLCTRNQVMAHWPLSRIHLVVGIFSGGVRTLTGSDYAGTHLKETNTDVLGGKRACAPDSAYGFSVFYGPQVTQQDLIDLGAAITSESYAQPRDETPRYADLILSR